MSSDRENGRGEPERHYFARLSRKQWRCLGEKLELTARETDVLALWMCGLKQFAVGQALGIKEGTVRAHVRHIYAKQGVTSRFELAERLFDELGGPPRQI